MKVGLLASVYVVWRRRRVISADSAVDPASKNDVLMHLAETLSISAQFRPSVEQARRLGVTTFDGTTNPAEVLSWLAKMEKILHEGMRCPDVDKIRIARFLKRFYDGPCQRGEICFRYGQPEGKGTYFGQGNAYSSGVTTFICV
ncbi:hypothetical protein FNV43_RR17031 [Rhamnella rubrinervis]|uniref:Uncharacterized protein n=1 Tax=Rhamnella rubrinervis TaxID=2594499 RepID=A0A8K0GZY0_9ROSA|nr:hypothetical protein FNV43_RR17031 [Rhamnella rubrinervis]